LIAPGAVVAVAACTASELERICADAALIIGFAWMLDGGRAAA
jgi:hypothetical protein